MATPTEFAAACRQTSRAARRLPAEVRRDLKARVRDRVAEPIAADVRAGGSTTYTRLVAGTTRVRADADPTVVLGGARRLVSGGARGRDLVFGAQFGGGKAVVSVPSRPGQRAHRRRSTMQFGGRDPFVFATLRRNIDRYLGLWADVVVETVGRVIPGGK